MSFPTLAHDLQNAFVQLEQGKSEEAASSFRGILAAMPTCLEARYGQMVAGGASSDSELANLLREIVNQHAFVFPGLLLHAGGWLMLHEHWELAAKAFESARRLLPVAPMVALPLAECRLALGDALAAETEACAIPAASPDEANGRFLLGRALLLQRRLPEAIAIFRQCPEFRENSAVRDHLSYALFLAGRWDEALAATGLLASPPRKPTPVTLFVASRCFMQVGDFAKAEKFLLLIPWHASYLAAQRRAARASPLASADLNAGVMKAWWASYGECLRAQGWFERALVECDAPLDSLDPVVCSEMWSSNRPTATPRVTLVSFSSNDSFGEFQKRLCRSALDTGGFDEAVLWTSERLRETEFYRRHPTILGLSRGAGVWAWKPYIIYNELLRRADGEYVVYYDCGRKGNTIEKPLTELIAWCERSSHGILPGVVTLAGGPAKVWSKRDCFHFMGADSPTYWDHPQVQATFSMWKNSAFARAFVLEWMKLAVDPRLISDHPNVGGAANHPGFLDHRHDQSILTNLVVRHGLSLPTYGSKNINGLSDVLVAESSR